MYIFALVTRDETIAFIEKFRWIDKHETFKSLMPSVTYIGDDQKEVLSEIIRVCCTNLLAIYRNKRIKPTKAQLRKIVSHCMDEIARADIHTDNKDFGYELGWYLGEKLGIDLKKSSYGKIWGYWRVIDKNVVVVRSVRKK